MWQEHGLCDDLDAVANIFLGRPGRWVVPESALRDQAAVLLRRVGAHDLRLDVPLRVLSRGQRQLVAVARALLTAPRLLVMDEPTAPLGVAESALVESILWEAREAGASVLLAIHDLEQVFTLADRIVVLRDGAVVADVSPVEVQRSDVVALMSGVEADSIASRQIRRLQSLADQLSEAEPAASLLLIVSAMAGALEVDMLCVHLLEITGEQPVLRRLAATGLPPGLLGLNAALPVGAEGGPAGLAAARGAVVVVDDLQTRSTWPAGTAAAAASGVRSAWAAPILGSDGVLGTVSGYATSPGNPAPERLELATIYLRYAASAIERERLLTEVSRRNRVLESLRGLLESLAGPERLQGGLEISLLALLDGLGADTAAVMAADGEPPGCRCAAGETGPGVLPGLAAAASAVLSAGDDIPARLPGIRQPAGERGQPRRVAAGHGRHRPGGPIAGLGGGGDHRLRGGHPGRTGREDLRAAGPGHHRGGGDRAGTAHRTGDRGSARWHPRGGARGPRGVLRGRAPGRSATRSRWRAGQGILERGGGTGGTTWWLTRRWSSSWRTTRTSSTWSGPTSPPAATT